RNGSWRVPRTIGCASRSGVATVSPSSAPFAQMRPRLAGASATPRTFKVASSGPTSPSKASRQPTPQYGQIVSPLTGSARPRITPPKQDSPPRRQERQGRTRGSREWRGLTLAWLVLHALLLFSFLLPCPALALLAPWRFHSLHFRGRCRTSGAR